MRRQVVAITLLAIALINARPLFAEPSGAVRYLMNKNLSMLDWGLYRIEQLLDKTSFGAPGVGSKEMHASTRYNWDENRIAVNLSTYFFDTAAPDRIGACKNMIVFSRSLLGIDSNTGKKSEVLANVSAFFVSSAFQEKDQPTDLESTLLAIIDLEATVIEFGGASKDGSRTAKRTTKCQGKLLSEDIYFAK